jgi:hypothetical protein
MPSPTKPASVTASSETAYSIERRTRAHVLDTADAVRAEKRRASFAAIDSNASKWRYPAIGVTS